MKYHVLTLGCQMNLSDSQRLDTVFASMGFEKTREERDADILGIMACSVRQKAIDKVHSRIHRWNAWKKNRNLVTFVTGCLLEGDKKKFLKSFDLVFDTNDIPALPGMISQYGIVTPMALEKHYGQKEFWGIAPSRASSFEAYIPIQNGCDKFCSYCAVPHTRGREISRPSKDILEEMAQLVGKGFKSITLLGQNVNSYGRDKKGNEISFAALLEEIGKMGEASDQKFWLYFTAPHPRDMGEDVLEVMARYGCLAKQIHLPLQSGDDAILGKMNRKYTVADYKSIMEKIRTLLPEATVFTDIITGFPGETEGQFENTCRSMEELAFNMAYIACYSPRSGTASARWDDSIPQNIKKKRLHILSDIVIRSAGTWNQDLIGHTLDILVNGKSRDASSWTGLTEGKINIHFSASENKLKNGSEGLGIGDFCKVLVCKSTGLSLQGTLA